MDQRFTTVVLGARDFYQIPLALYEGNALGSLVTDLYVSETLRRLRASRQKGTPLTSPEYLKIPRRLVKTEIGAMILRILASRGMTTPAESYFKLNRQVSLTAAKIAKRTNTDLFMYSESAFWAFEELQDRNRYLFQYHPHPLFMRDLLAEDFQNFPEIGISYHAEPDSKSLSETPPERIVEWSLATRILCASSFTKRSLVAQGCPPDKVVVNPYGAWPSSANLPRPDRGARCKFLFVGQGIQRKGLHHLLRAWRLANLPNADLRLVCSRLDPGIVPMIEQRNVIASGPVSRSELDRIFFESDIFVLPSMIEGFGLAITEALAAGMYVIGTTNTGLPDLKPPKNIASIIEPANVQKLAQTLEETFQLWNSGAIDPGAAQEFSRRRRWSDFRADVRSFAIGSRVVAAEQYESRSPDLVA